LAQILLHVWFFGSQRKLAVFNRLCAVHDRVVSHYGLVHDLARLMLRHRAAMCHSIVHEGQQAHVMVVSRLALNQLDAAVQILKFLIFQDWILWPLQRQTFNLFIYLVDDLVKRLVLCCLTRLNSL